MNKVKDNIALVTGASSGIGEATAILLAQNGYTVYAGARRVDRMERLKSFGIHILRLDLASEASILSAVETLVAVEGTIDVLVNSAGFGYFGAIEDMTIRDARYQMEVNVFGMARMCQLVLPYMRKQHSGKIVNISSIGGKLATPLGGWYHASKHAVEGLSDSLRLEVKPFGIDVIIIEPGAVKTEWRKVAMIHGFTVSGASDYRELMQKASVVKNRGETGIEPIQIAQLIKTAIELRNPQARYVGGYLAKPILFLRKWLSDRSFDRLIMRRFR